MRARIVFAGTTSQCPRARFKDPGGNGSEWVDEHGQQHVLLSAEWVVPLPDRLARIDRRVTNPIMRTFAGRVPGFAIVVHRGRRTGRQYRTPVNAFRSPGGFVIALTYGPDRDWVRNVLAAGGCTIEWRGRPRRLGHPTVRRDDQVRHLVPAPVRLALGLLRVSAVLTLDRSRRQLETSRAPISRRVPLAVRSP